MTASSGTTARSLIVLSRDYGELGLAMWFLRGQEFASRARIVLPESLHASNAGTLPVPATPWTSHGDILAAVDAHRPDLVFLFCGYLFAIDGPVSQRLFRELVQEILDRGCQVVTSDPFLGLTPRLTLAEMDVGMLVSGLPLFRRWLSRVVLHVWRPQEKVVSVPIIEDVPHLYPTAIPAVDGEDSVPRFTFYNPTMLRAPEPSPGAAAGASPKWLFVLSSVDLACQRRLMGFRTFSRYLARTLQRTLDLGAKPTLVAPTAVVDVLRGLSGEIEMVPHASFVEFESLLLSADYAFYWNAFSFSILPRVANQLPVFLFDRGHLSRTVKPIYHLGLSCHYGGWVPPYLDPRQTLDQRALAAVASSQALPMRLIRERWQSSPSPDQVVERLMRDRQR